MPTNLRNILMWTEAGQHYGIPLEAVQKVVRLVAITPLPAAPPGVLGLINVEGRVLPVLSLHQCFHPAVPRPPGFTDQLILAQCASRGLALLAQEIQGLVSVLDADLAPPGDAGHHLPQLLGILKHPDGLVLLPKLEALGLAPALAPEPLLALPGGPHGS